MPKAIDIKGQSFGELVAVAYHESRAGSGRIWRCHCSCGKACFVSVKNLLRGRVISCGHYRRTVIAGVVGAKRALELSNRRFGRLKAIEVVGRYGRSCLWECECDCGATVRVPVSSLTSGATRSCGCLRSEVTTARNKKRVSNPVLESI